MNADISNRFTSYFSNARINFSGFIPHFQRPYTLHMSDLIALGVQVAKDRIIEYCIEYTDWTSVHNQKCDDAVPDEECSNSSSQDQDSTLGGQTYHPLCSTVATDAPPTKLFQNFCDTKCQHESFNRFLLLNDLDESIIPQDLQRDYCFCLLPKYCDWLQKHVPGIGEHGYPYFNQGMYAPQYPYSYEFLINHLEGKKEGCIYHKLA